MTRLKITCDGDPKDRRIKLKLLEILAPADVYANALYEANGGYIINASEKEVDTVLESAATQTLQSHGFYPILPPEIKARRTIICHKVEQTAFENTKNDIADEIENKQESAKIQDAYKFPNNRNNTSGNTLKIQFETISMADKATKQALRLFNEKVPPSLPREVSSNKNRQSQLKELVRKNTLQVQGDSDGDSTSPAGSDSEDDHSDEEVNGLEVVIVKKNTDMWPRTRTFPHMERGVREGRYKIRHNLSASDYDLVIDRLRKMDRPVDHLLTSVRDAVFDTMPSGPFTSSEPSLKKRRGRKKKTQTA
ncbi:hypothetical protein O3P69_018934 [Scylla paramamosain]|uniref:Uncharacterized protein n=1 Tax=Scylla paramamosain TaxID=85552 RepID=A0AAW0SH19_SCYPA